MHTDLRRDLAEAEAPCDQDDDDGGEAYGGIDADDEAEGEAPGEATRGDSAAEEAEERAEDSAAKDFADALGDEHIELDAGNGCGGLPCVRCARRGRWVSLEL